MYKGGLWSHRGDQCTLDTMLQESTLLTEPLQQLATIVRAADTSKLDLALQVPRAGMQLYEAFYRGCRDATVEEHQWVSSEQVSDSGE